MNAAEIFAPEPAIVHRAGSDAAFLVICDHAGQALPPSLGDLGIAAAEFERHIAWDIGAGDLSLRLGEALGACTILQRYSRLVIDCNRAPGAAGSIPEVADGTTIPGNLGLDLAGIATRVAAIHTPYHAAIARELDGRAGEATTVLLLVHSFTPRLRASGFDRPWRFGVLHEGSSAFSLAALERLRAVAPGPVGDNEPYRMDDVDYTAPRHAIARGLEYLELEVRQDLLADAAGVAAVADLLTPVLAHALESIS